MTLVHYHDQVTPDEGGAMRTVQPLLLALSLVFLPAASALAVDGPALYEKHCIRCHGDTGAADTWRGILYFARNFTSARWQARESDAGILKAINRGPGPMPAFESKLSLEEREALVKVVRDFGAEAQ
jgi:mono/diheme cytochrome c family protein